MGRLNLDGIKQGQKNKRGRSRKLLPSRPRVKLYAKVKDRHNNFAVIN